MKVMKAGWLNFSEQMLSIVEKELEWVVSKAFLFLFSFLFFFTCHMTYGPQSFATEQ